MSLHITHLSRLGQPQSIHLKCRWPCLMVYSNLFFSSPFFIIYTSYLLSNLSLNLIISFYIPPQYILAAVRPFVLTHVFYSVFHPSVHTPNFIMVSLFLSFLYQLCMGPPFYFLSGNKQTFLCHYSFIKSLDFLTYIL